MSKPITLSNECIPLIEAVQLVAVGDALADLSLALLGLSAGLEPWLDGLVLLIEVVHVRNQILIVRKRREQQKYSNYKHLKQNNLKMFQVTRKSAASKRLLRPVCTLSPVHRPLPQEEVVLRRTLFTTTHSLSIRIDRAYANDWHVREWVDLDGVLLRARLRDRLQAGQSVRTYK